MDKQKEQVNRGGRGPLNLADHISKDEAVKKLIDAWHPVAEKEDVHIADALGRTLCDDLFAIYDQPVVRASQMDGIAVRSADFAKGRPDTLSWKFGKDFIRADTGDDFDDAFDAVIQIEKAKILPEGGVQIDEDVEVTPGLNVSPAGSNIKKGTQVGRAGKVITPLDIAAIILGGYDTVTVYRKPCIAFIPTGSELVPAGSKLQRGQNFDSNSAMVNAMLTRMGAEVILHPIIRDDKKEIAAALEKLLQVSDVVILNAGTSKGEEDYCFQYLKENGNMLFHGVKAVPGRPMSITMIADKPVINMSGPAVAAYNGCIWLMTKVIDRMLCHTEEMYLPSAEAVLTKEFGGPPFMSAFSSFDLSLDEEGTLVATPVPGRGPGSRGMSAGLMADAHYITEIGEQPHQAGDRIKVLLAK